MLNAELIVQVSAKPVVRGELLRDLQRERFVEASLDVDHGKLVQLALRVSCKLHLFHDFSRILIIAQALCLWP